MAIEKSSISYLIQQGEGHNVEFKVSFSSGLSKEICAFANTSGGRILLGVDDDATVKGIKLTNSLLSQVQDLARNMDPPVKIDMEPFENILVIHVPEGLHKPHSANGKFYMRHGANSQQLTRNEIRDLFRNERLLMFDDIPNTKFNLTRDLFEEAFRSFMTLARIRTDLDRELLFENLLLTENGQMKNAGVLLFCETVDRFFLNATTTCVLYRGSTKEKILDRKEYKRDLYSNFREVMIYLQQHLDTEYIIRGGPREEKLELPEEALREAILNAMAHRDYFSTANIQVSIFADRVEISNPGGLIGDLLRPSDGGGRNDDTKDHADPVTWITHRLPSRGSGSRGEKPTRTSRPRKRSLGATLRRRRRKGGFAAREAGPQQEACV